MRKVTNHVLEEKEVLLTLENFLVHPMVKLIASLGVSQRLQASQNILEGKKKVYHCNEVSH